MSAVNRRALLSGAASIAAGAGFATVVAEAAPAKTPDERIDAALEEIKDALLEMNPSANCRVCRIGGDDGKSSTFMVISGLSFLKPGQIQYMRDGRIVRREGGAQ